MRIMLLAPGNATHSQRFLQLLIDSGHRVTFVDRHAPMQARDGNYTYFHYPNHAWLNFVRPYALRTTLKDRLAAFDLRSLWRRSRSEVVHLLGIDRRAYHCALAQLHPLVVTAWGSDVNDVYEQKPDSEQRRTMMEALLRADHVTADAGEVLERCNSLAQKKLSSSLFYFGIDLDLFKPRRKEEIQELRKRLGFPEGARVILSPRRLLPKLGHRHVLQAFINLTRQGMENIVLAFRRFSSYPSDYEDELKTRAKEEGVERLVYWVDEMDYVQLPVLYSLADVIVNFPEQDGLPVTLFEASACMTPVVTSDLEAYRSFLSKGDYLRAPVGDVNRLVQCLEDVLRADRRNLQEALEKNLSLVREVADQRACVGEIERVYQSLASQN